MKEKKHSDILQLFYDVFHLMADCLLERWIRCKSARKLIICVALSPVKREVVPPHQSSILLGYWPADQCSRMNSNPFSRIYLHR
jgi:hypothetical protein